MINHGIERAPDERVNWKTSAGFLAAHAVVLLTFLTGITPTAVVLFLVFHGAFMFFLIVGLITGYRFSFESGQQAAARDKDVEEARRAADQLNDRHAVNSFDGNA